MLLIGYHRKLWRFESKERKIGCFKSVSHRSKYYTQSFILSCVPHLQFCIFQPRSRTWTSPWGKGGRDALKYIGKFLGPYWHSRMLRSLWWMREVMENFTSWDFCVWSTVNNQCFDLKWFCKMLENYGTANIISWRIFHSYEVNLSYHCQNHTMLIESNDECFVTFPILKLIFAGRNIYRKLQ